MSKKGAVKTTFHWNDKFKIDKSKKYVVLLRGCFCPPTRGHFQLVEQFVTEYDNVHVHISQMGSEKRHGIPYELNRSIWLTYIEHALPINTRSRVTLQRLHGVPDIIPIMQNFGADTIIWLKGNEDVELMSRGGMSKEQRIELRNRRREYERRFYAGRGIIRGICKKYNKNLMFVFQDRVQMGHLSASKFIEELKAQKKRYKSGKQIQLSKLRFFMPYSLPEEHQKEMIRELLKYKVHGKKK